MKTAALFQSARGSLSLRFCMLFLVVSCVTTSAAPPARFYTSQSGRERSSFIATGGKGAVAAAHPLASQAAIDALKAGGNAVDAAVAASFVISVVRPQSTGIGGGGFMLLHRAGNGGAENKSAEVFDFRERAPLRATRDMYVDASGTPIPFKYGNLSVPNASVNGHLAAGVPGLVKGLFEAHKAHGRLAWKTLLQPAIRAAREGFPVYDGLATAMEERREILDKFPASRAIFLPDGKPMKKGETLKQLDLAKTLEIIADKGADGFYKGAVAQAIVKEMQNGILSQEDLDTYVVLKRVPVEGTFRGYRVVSMPPPSSGGVHIVQMLNMLEGDALDKHDPYDPENVHLVAEVMRRAFADRAELLGDADFVKVPVKGIISKEYAKSLRQSVRMEAATPSPSIKKSNAATYESPSTTHISIVDNEGNAVATTQTINFTFGSCVVVPGTGIVMNDEMDDFSIRPGVPNAFGLVGGEANAIAARKTMLSSMSPTIVFNPEGKIHLVLGSPGGPRIISVTFLTILNVLAYHLPLPDAVHLSRIHHQWLPDKLRV